MGQLTITLPDDQEAMIRELVIKGRYGSVSDLVRDAIRERLEQPSYWNRFNAVINLENNKMLSKLLDESWNSEELLQGLRQGYVSEYETANHLVYDNELSKAQSDFVFDVLHMYDRLQLAAREIGDEKLQQEVLYEGFDGNGEYRYLGFVRFLVETHRFTFVKPLDKDSGLNSHIPMIEVYQRMLDVFKPLDQDKRRILTRQEVGAVLEARIHPSNR